MRQVRRKEQREQQDLYKLWNGSVTQGNKSDRQMKRDPGSWRFA